MSKKFKKSIDIKKYIWYIWKVLWETAMIFEN